MILSNFWNRIIAYSGILFFVFCKLPWLHCGFYWDESWVYGPAIRAMYHHGPSLLPSAISTDLSRGHPLLFQAGCAMWMKVFGPSVFSMHCFALTVSAALAVALYEIMQKLSGSRIALTALCLLLLNVSFFVFSAYVMTDVAIALFAFLVIYFWSCHRYIAATVALSLLLLTKEGGIMMIAALAAEMMLRHDKSHTRQKLLTLLAATAVIALFYCTQKIMLGWYLFPGHISAINPGWDNLHNNIIRTLRAMLIQEPMYTSLIVVFLFAAGVSVARKAYSLMALLFVLVVTYLVIIYLSNRDIAYYAYVILLGGCLVWCYRRYITATPHHTVVRLSFTFGILFALFSCVNFFETRYLFPVLFLGSCVILPIFIGRLYTLMPAAAGLCMMLSLAIAGFLRFSASGTDISQFDRMAVQQQLVDYVEQNHLYDSIMCSASFLDHIHLTDPNTGFLRGNDTCRKVTEQLTLATRFVIMNNIDGVNSFDSIRNSSRFRMVRKFARHAEWVELWARR